MAPKVLYSSREVPKIGTQILISDGLDPKSEPLDRYVYILEFDNAKFVDDYAEFIWNGIIMRMHPQQ